MKPLQDCEFSAFISYAHADDAAWYDWVTHFRNELDRGLRNLLRGVKLPPLHLSGENGPVSGRLSDELKKRVAASFAMIIVVHDNYAQSDWCLRELEYFRSLHADEGFRDRLYIVALSEPAMQLVSSRPVWHELVPGDDQLWVPFFDPSAHHRPVDVYMGPGLVAPQFRTPFERLRGDLAAKLKLAALAVDPGRAGVAPLPPPPQPPRDRFTRPMPLIDLVLDPPQPPPVVSAGPVVFGFVPTALQPQVAALVAQLAAAGVPARLLQTDAMVSDFAELADAVQLVLAFDDSVPMMASMAAGGGGHLALQRDAWLNKGRPPGAVHWLDLRPDIQAPAEGAARYVAAQGVATLVPEALLELLRPKPQPPPGVAPVQGVRIYIESNRNERTLWEPLGEQIRRRWDELFQHLAPERVPPLTLRARGLPVDQIDSFPPLDDADGVVLLWGKKTSDALVAQINKVENKMPPGRDGAPGIVAYLMPPQASTEPLPAWGWQVLRFDARDEEHIDVIADERDEMQRFLERVFQRRQARDLASAR
jgi:hypothetical protein